MQKISTEKPVKRPFMVYADDELRGKLEEIADREDRSLSNVCVRMLRNCVERDAATQ